MLDEVCRNMSRHQKRTPSLEDALAKGFSELKAGEANLPPIEDEKGADEASSPEASTEPQPILYNKAYEAVEDREEFVVANPTQDQEAPSQSSVPEEKSKPEVVDVASSVLGDEFDVEW